MTPLLSAKNIYMAYSGVKPVEVIKDLSLEVFKGETIAITGKSGSGKSTLLNILGTLEHPTSGKVTLCGHDTQGSASSIIRNKHIGFIFQSFHLLDDFSLLDNVLMPAKIGRKQVGRNSESYKRALSLLDQVGLSEQIDCPTKILSGGEKQRACLARALCNNPDLIFADEPTGNLDSANTEIVASLLIKSAKEGGKTLILVTHDEDLAKMCDKTFHLKDGFLHRIR
jgi:lipoprotein-releasing system ATP-binding protein